MTIVGTSHFISFNTAVEYYTAQEGDSVTAEQVVIEKLAAQEIHLGVPEFKSGERIVLLDNTTRYGIESKD